MVDLTASVDGTRTGFALGSYRDGTVRVFLNGRLLEDDDFEETSDGFELAEAPVDGDTLFARVQR